MRQETVIVLDFGGQYNQLIARRVRECGVYCEVKPYTTSIEELRAMAPIGLILTGGPGSVYAADAPKADPAIFALGVPVLGICYGCQLMAQYLGGSVVPAQEDTAREYGRTDTHFDTGCALFAGLEAEGVTWMSHGDYMERVPDGFRNTAHTAVFVDHGLLRKGEADEVERVFSDRELNFVRVDARDRFLIKLAGVSEPERKRRIIGEEFIRVFEAEAKKIGAVDFLAQGTIYPDVIESGAGDAAVIKSHHNVGGLPDYVDFREIIEPLRMLFKDEVRQLGRELGLPESLVMRQPFPGPGLAIRVIGDVTEDKLSSLREADAIFREELAASGLPKLPDQYFAVLTDTRSVGVMGDGRTYDYTLALRAVETSDFMTADWFHLPWELLDRVSTRIVNEVGGINRVVYDITSKPPATIEWE